MFKKKILTQTIKKNLDKSFILAQHIVPQKLIGSQLGKLADSQHPVIKKVSTELFSKVYGIELDDYARKKLADFDSFNDFFTRELDEDARDINKSHNVIACPADGCISQLGRIEANQILQAKGKHYSLENLLACPHDASHFYEGNFATVYLAPSNYHRVHMPFDAKLIKTRYVPGDLFSVNNLTAKHVDNLFARNERMVCLFEAEHAGNRFKMAVVLVGAMVVAGIETIATGRMEQGKEIIEQQQDITLKKGDELGRFYLGSTAIVIVPKQLDITFNAESGSLVKMGQALASIV